MKIENNINKNRKEKKQQEIHIENSKKLMLNKLKNIENGISRNRKIFLKNVLRADQYKLSISINKNRKSNIW